MSGKKHNASIPVRLFLFISLLGSVLFPAPQAAQAVVLTTPPGWIYRTIDSQAKVWVGPSLAVDHAGTPHAAHLSFLNQSYRLVYSVYDGSQWQEQWAFPGEANSINLALDSEDNPHLTFMLYEGNYRILYYAFRDGQEWITEALTTDFSAGQYNSLVLDEAGLPHVAYLNQSTGNIMVAFNDGSGWQHAAVVESEGGRYFSHISLALDANDHPHIAFCAGEQMDACDILYYAVFDGQLLNLSEVDQLPGGVSVSLALDSEGLPRISAYQPGAGLTYHFFDGSTWQAQTVAAGAEGVFADLALDAHNFPHIAYFDQTNADLKYARFDGAAWQYITLNSYGTTGLYPALGLDPAGQPHIAYIDQGEGALKYAGKPPLPDLTITEVWASPDGALKAAVQNSGLAPVTGLVQVTFWLDGIEYNPVNTNASLAPQERLVTSLEWTCSGKQDQINACVYMDPLDEIDPDNNCYQVTILCDVTPPMITAGPAASDISASSATIHWTTNEPTTSRVVYGSVSGERAEAGSSDLQTVHSITLQGLSAKKVYSYRVESVDEAGLTVTSRQIFFHTLAGGIQPPPAPTQFKAERLGPEIDRFNLEVDFPNTDDIQKVSFFVGGQLVGSSFSPAGGRYVLAFNPAEWWPDNRGAFFNNTQPVTVEVQVLSYSGQVSTNQYSFMPGLSYGLIEAKFITPYPNEVIYIPGAYAPTRLIPIDVLASQFEYSCEWAGSSGQDCTNFEKQIKQVKFFVNGVFKTTQTSPLAGQQHTYRYNWNIQNLIPGGYTIEAVVEAADGSSKTITRSVSIQTGEANLSVSRVVTRVDNYFDVALVITSHAPVGVPVKIAEVFESMVGFQPVRRTDESFRTTAVIQGDMLSNQVKIFATNQTLNPGESLTVHYQVIPILLQNPASVAPRIGVGLDAGSFGTVVAYNQAGQQKTASFNQETVVVYDPSTPGSLWPSIPQAVSRAFAASDYLIISSPEKMAALNWTTTKISSLMGYMGRLAMLKNGILVYWPAAASKDSLNGLLQDNSAWTNRLHPNFQMRGKGYVLLVGETNIIPSYTTGPFDVHWSDDDDASNMRVKYSDNPFAHTDGNGAPDLLLGRIVGNSASDLEAAVITSINTHLGVLSNDLSHVYLASGVGNGIQMMQSDVNSSASYFASRGLTVSKHHWETEGWLNEWPWPLSTGDGFAAGDLDGNGFDELVIASVFQNLVFILDGAGQEVSRFTLNFQAGDVIATGDVDNDGRDEIVHAGRANLVRIIGLEDGQWKVEKLFMLGFRAGDSIAVGQIVDSSPEDEIVVADAYNNRIGIYDQNGTRLLPWISLNFTGRKFGANDKLAIGNVGVSAAGVNEIVFTDQSRSRLVVMSANGSILKEMPITFFLGGQLAIADIYSEDFDEILIGQGGGSVDIYQSYNNDPARAYKLLRSIYKLTEARDGLAVRRIPGDYNDEIFQADYSLNKIIKLDPNYPDKNKNTFRYGLIGQDLLVFNAHGSSSGMGPSVQTDLFPLFLGNYAPMIHAFSCLTGDYESGNGYGLVEAFFGSGAGAYIGSTEVSPMSKNSNMVRKLYSEFWVDGQPFIKALLNLKNNRWNVSEYYDWWRLVVNEYNYYGDPKFELRTPEKVKPGAANLAAAGSMQSLPANIQLDLPDVILSTQGAFDVVEIPGGDEYLEKDQPIVPTYTLHYPVAAGTSVQDVRLAARSKRTEFSGLTLPLTVMVPSSRAHLPAFASTPDPAAEWTPASEQPYTWSVNNENDGSSTLTILVYPFRYKAAVGYAEYYQHFEFDLITSPSDTHIANGSMSAGQYRTGETLSLHLEIEKEGLPADRVISASIYPLGSETLAGGFALSSLANFSGTGSLVLEAPSTALNPGSYIVRVEIFDNAGIRYDWREWMFRLGVPEGKVSLQAADKERFVSGDQVIIIAVVENTGDQQLDTQLVVEIPGLDEAAPVRWTETLTGLLPGSRRSFEFVWDSSGAETGVYPVTAYLIYDSQISPIARLEIDNFYITNFYNLSMPFIWR
jgi:hypothetical protein